MPRYRWEYLRLIITDQQKTLHLGDDINTDDIIPFNHFTSTEREHLTSKYGFNSPVTYGERIGLGFKSPSQFQPSSNFGSSFVLKHYALEYLIGKDKLLEYDIIEAGPNFSCGSSR